MTKKTKQQPQKNHPLAVWRLYLVMGVVLILFLGLGTRAAWIQVIDNDFLKSQGDSRTVRYQGINGQRGVIRDRNGIELASSIPVYSLWLDPVSIFKEQEKYPDLFETPAWVQLASLVEMTGKELTSWVQKRASRRFVWLQRHIEPTHASIIDRLNMPGVSLQQESRRFYPAAEITAHVVGFTDIDERGIEGIERAFDERLRGEDGKRKIIKDRKGNPISAADVLDNALLGEDINLALDIRIQTNAYKRLKMAVKQYRAKAGSAVVLDIDTGEVLAMVNQPSYNPNNPNERIANATRNRAITDVFEPGSTVKPLTAVSALSSNKYKANSIIDTSPGLIRLGGRWVRDGINHGKLSVSQVIEKSSNVGVAKMALSLDDETFLDSFYQVGFGTDNATGFPGETAGHLNVRKNWSAIEKATLSFGYGLDVSTLQLAKAYAIIGGLGKSRPISLLKVDGPVPAEQKIEAHVASQIVKMMEQVVSSEGTGNRARVDGYRVSGKTGTARKAVAGGYGDEYFAVFAGVAPVRNPRIAVVVMIDDPQGEDYYGGEVSAPVFADIMKQTLRTLNIAPDTSSQESLRLIAGGGDE
ncbi:MAG: peptidoglycan glycosyltransferase FtsI [Gammaproteobacteria bacterium]|nr:peptidoglycan glycosyltransferase FtsI [Gammaproteobacteria bacterium]NNJ72386.1 peptidoglycan glycosyltransferase FtsI [Enterobacterales bacterium]